MSEQVMNGSEPTEPNDTFAPIGVQPLYTAEAGNRSISVYMVLRDMFAVQEDLPLGLARGDRMPAIEWCETFREAVDVAHLRLGLPSIRIGPRA